MANQEATSQIIIELQQAIEKQQAEIESLKKSKESFRPAKITQDVASSKIVRDDRPGPGGGWVIKTKRPWNGVRSGIRFVGGYGIIDVGMPESDALAHLFEADYGYNVYPVEEEDLNQIRIMRERVAVDDPDESVAEKLLKSNAFPSSIGK